MTYSTYLYTPEHGYLPQQSNRKTGDLFHATLTAIYNWQNEGIDLVGAGQDPRLGVFGMKPHHITVHLFSSSVGSCRSCTRYYDTDRIHTHRYIYTYVHTYIDTAPWKALRVVDCGHRSNQPSGWLFESRQSMASLQIKD